MVPENIMFLKHRINGRIFAYTANLAKKDTMIPCTKEGIATGRLENPDDAEKALVESQKENNELKKEISRLNIYVLRLEAKAKLISSPRVERGKELISLSRKDLLAVAASKGISHPAVKYRNGKEPLLVEDILLMEFPDSEE